MKAGCIKKEHYAYQKFGSASVLACIEPLTGERLAHIRRHRTKKEFTWFMQNVAKKYAQAKKIRVVLDNLNTHNESAFYENKRRLRLLKGLNFIIRPNRLHGSIHCKLIKFIF